MSTLYRPVEITSAEQAEALPIGAMAYRDLTAPLCRDIAVKTGEWEDPAGVIDPPWWINHQEGADDYRMVGFTALVPIEAEEERDDEWADYGGVNRRRLVTPWEEQS